MSKRNSIRSNRTIYLQGSIKGYPLNEIYVLQLCNSDAGGLEPRTTRPTVDDVSNRPRHLHISSSTSYYLLYNIFLIKNYALDIFYFQNYIFSSLH